MTIDADFRPEDINRPARGPKWLTGAIVSVLVISVIAGGLFFYSKVIQPSQVAEEKKEVKVTMSNKPQELDPLLEFEELKPPPPDPMTVQKEEAYVEQAAFVPEPPAAVEPRAYSPPKEQPPAIDWSVSSTTIESVSSSGTAVASGGEQAAATGSTGALMGKTSEPPPSGVGVAISRNDLDTRLNRGTVITGNMQTRLDTTFSGQGVCVLDKPLFSANGKTKLLDAGDFMLGTYDSGMITPGVRRIAMVWDMLKSNNGAVEVSMNSPGTDPLGTTGMGAHIDTKFWARWNEVLMASFFDVVINEASGSASNSGEQVVIGMASATSSLAQDVFRSRADIKPIAYNHQGTKCGTTLAHDLVFSGVRRGSS